MKQNQQFTVGLIVVAIALGAYGYFVESKKDAPVDTKDVEIWSLSDNQAKNITPLNITTDGKTVVYTRSGDEWKLQSEPTRTIDKSNFDTSFNYLKNLTATRKVEDKPSDPGKYGFKTPATVVAWGDASSKYKLEVGDKSPTGDAYYVHALKDDGVYTIPAYKIEAWKTLVSKPPLMALPTPGPSPAKAATAAATATAVAPALKLSTPTPAAVLPGHQRIVIPPVTKPTAAVPAAPATGAHAHK